MLRSSWTLLRSCSQCCSKYLFTSVNYCLKLTCLIKQTASSFMAFFFFPKKTFLFVIFSGLNKMTRYGPSCYFFFILNPFFPTFSLKNKQRLQTRHSGFNVLPSLLTEREIPSWQSHRIKCGNIHLSLRSLVGNYLKQIPNKF